MQRCFPILVCVALACTGPGSSEQREKSELWITVGVERLNKLQSAFARLGLTQVLQPLREQGGVAISKISGTRVPLLSRLLHKESRRCAGFIAHSSYESALFALEGPLGKPAVEKRFVAYSIDNSEVTERLIGSIDEARITETITALERYPNRYYTSPTGIEAAHWLRDRWQGLVVERADAKVELFVHDAYPQPSVILTLEGTKQREEVVVIGGHVDSIVQGEVETATRAPGADDNASGIASMTEVIRVAFDNGYVPERTVKFMAYAAEEVGLRGSWEIANAHRKSEANIVGVIQLDMTNFNGSDDDIVLMHDYTNAPQNRFVTDLIDRYLGVRWSFGSCGYACSDHASWTAAGYPSSMPFESHFADMNPHIHTRDDTIAASGEGAEHAAKFAKLAAAYMAELAKGHLRAP